MTIEILQTRLDAAADKLKAEGWNGVYLHGDPSSRLRHLLNPRRNPLYRDSQPIAGEFGLQLVDRETRRGVAVCSFDLTERGDGFAMYVMHTPQGLPADSWRALGRSRGERQRLLKEDFRALMLRGVVEVGQDIGAAGIEVVSAVNHFKYRSEQIDLAKAVRVIDRVALACGFQYSLNANLVLQLSE